MMLWPRLSHAFGRLLLALCIVGLTMTIAGAEVTTVESALARRSEFECRASRLDDVAVLLSRRYGIPVLVDRRALEAAGIQGGDLQISHRSADQPLSAVLDEMLAPHKLTWLVRHNVLFITTARAATEDYFDTRVYRVTKRVPVARRLNSITLHVAPDSWVLAGGKGDAAPLPPRLFLVHQSALVQRQIEEMFSGSIERIHVPQVAPATRKQDVEAQLAEPATLQFENTALSNVLQQLGQRHGVAVSVDDEALRAAGIHADKLRITLAVDKVPSLADALSLLLEQADARLTWLVDAGHVRLTTLVAGSKLRRRVYDVKQIVPDGDPKGLIEAIQFTVSAADWEFAGGFGTIESKGNGTELEILQSDPIHRQLKRLFAEMRAGATSGAEE